jgi:putative zinc finger/helix-turn-helix YgiT family protein
MKCLKCNNDSFAERKIRFGPEIKGQIVEIILPCKVCNKCGSPLIDSMQMNLIRRAAADKYRELNKLLTSSQIISYRESLKMSQKAFAQYLNIGDASIKRWETYYIQDASQDDHIRLKCDTAYAELNFLDIHWILDEPSIYSGNKKFDLERFKQIAVFIVKKFKESILFINKIHFYIDFLHFQKTGMSITGARYVPLKFGPCPNDYRAIYTSLVKGNILKEKPDHFYEALIDPDLTVFDDSEIETMNYILKLCKKYGAKKLYELSHQELGYTQTAENDLISYAYAKDLQIKKLPID